MNRIRQRATWLAQLDLARFLVVGSIGFGVDGAIMTLLHSGFAWSPLVARGVSFPCAVTVTWLLNRHWTFRHGRERQARRQYMYYLGIQLTGLAINFSVFAALVHWTAFSAAWPITALACGSILALLFTFPMSKWVAFATSRVNH